jgi:hypothetical protein
MKEQGMSSLMEDSSSLSSWLGIEQTGFSPLCLERI